MHTLSKRIPLKIKEERVHSLREWESRLVERQKGTHLVNWVKSAPSILEAVDPCLDIVPSLTDLANKIFADGVKGVGPTLESLSRLSALAVENQRLIQSLTRVILNAYGGNQP